MDNGSKCGSTWKLHEVYFRDPYDTRTHESAYLCETHYIVITSVLNEKVTELARSRDNLISERNKERIIAKENDTYYTDLKQPKIENLRKLVKQVLSMECRNIFCMANLAKLGFDKKIYSAHTFKPSGKRHYSYYFCSLKCFNVFKGMCGIWTDNKQLQLT